MVLKKAKRKKSVGIWLPTLKYGFTPNKETEYSAILGEIYAQVIRSKYYSLCADCSPCYPGQGDLNTKGYTPSYQLSPETYDEEYDTPLEIHCVK